MRRIIFFLALCFLPAYFLNAQAPRQYYFTHYTTASGLISTEVNGVLQDKDGFIWVGTNDGLQRYDGTRFRLFRHDQKDPRSIPSNIVWQLILDANKVLWILTADGHVGTFDTRLFQFHEVHVETREEGIMQTAIKKLEVDEFGHIFLLLMGKELITYDSKADQFSYRHNLFKLADSLQPSGFAQEPGTRKYWVGLQSAGFIMYDASTGQMNYAGHNPSHEPALEMFSGISNPYHLFFDSKHRIWFQSWGPGFPYVYSYDLKQRDKKPLQFEFITTLKTYYETQDFFEQKDGTIWLAGLGILAHFDEKLKEFQMVYNGYVNERSIVYERVNCLVEDRENNMWIATNTNGLYRFNSSTQFFLNIAHTNRVTKNPGRGSIMSMIQTKWGTILAGSWGDGLYCYDRNFNLVPANIKGIDNNYGPTVWSMYASRDSITLWLSGQPGLWAVNQANRSATFHNPPAFENKTVRQVVEDRSGNLWLGLQAFGIFKWNALQGKNKFDEGIKRFDKIPVTQINKIIVDKKNTVWIATSTHGLFAVDASTEQIRYHFAPEQEGAFHLPEAGVSSVLEYNDSTIVITTSSQVILFNRYLNRSVFLGSSETISGLIAAVERDAAGYLWISTTTGLYRVGVGRRLFIRFNRDDGIDNDHFILASSRTLPDGKLLFGSSDQFVAFDPSKVMLNSSTPKVTITDFKVMNRSLLVDSLLALKQIKLSSNKNSVVIEFSALTYNSPFLIKYKLEGLDEEWRVADQTNQAIYSYLPSRKYKFLIKALNEQGESTGDITAISIRINPPFWKTWWFYSFLLVILGLIIFGVDRERMKRKEAIQRMRSDIADNLHTQVTTALNNINILSEMARLKAGKDPEKSKEYIEQIHTKSHNMIIAMDDMLWSINPSNDNMVKTTDRMREYIDALENRYGVTIEIEVDKKVESLELNMKLRHDAFLTFKEGIKNLVTVGASNCHVYISLEKGNLVFATEFDTESCDIQQLNNLLHRQDLERRLKEMNANIDIDVHRKKSVITLEVPVQ